VPGAEAAGAARAEVRVGASGVAGQEQESVATSDAVHHNASQEVSQSDTFTSICHRGKTHSHKSRGDTKWEAQRVCQTVSSRSPRAHPS
jgi:hypothetical protein